MNELDYHAIGHQPDVAEGEHHVYVTLLGSWSPLFSLTPDEADLFAGRIKRAANRIREAEKRGGETRPVVEPRHIRIIDRGNRNGSAGRSVLELASAQRVEPFTYAPDPYARRDRLVGLSLCLLSTILVASVFILVAWRYA